MKITDKLAKDDIVFSSIDAFERYAKDKSNTTPNDCFDDPDYLKFYLYSYSNGRDMIIYILFVLALLGLICLIGLIILQ